MMLLQIILNSLYTYTHQGFLSNIAVFSSPHSKEPVCFAHNSSAQDLHFQQGLDCLEPLSTQLYAEATPRLFHLTACNQAVKYIYYHSHFLISFHCKRQGWGRAAPGFHVCGFFLNYMRTIFSFSSLAVSGFPAVAHCLYLGSVTRSNYGLKIWLWRSKTAGLLFVTKQGPSVVHNTCLKGNHLRGPCRGLWADVLLALSPKVSRILKPCSS